MFWLTHHLRIEFVLLSILAFFFNICCEKMERENEWIKFTIKKGSHESSPRKMEYIKKDKMHFKVYFDSSAIYASIDSANQSDINKLYGITDCGSTIHQNSARFGWRWCQNSQCIEILAYCYNNGKVIKKSLAKVNICTETECEIRIDSNKYLFSINKHLPDTIERGCSDPCSKRYICYPYFGGNETAPHDIKVKIMDL